MNYKEQIEREIKNEIRNPELISFKATSSSKITFSGFINFYEPLCFRYISRNRKQQTTNFIIITVKGDTIRKQPQKYNNNNNPWLDGWNVAFIHCDSKVKSHFSLD